MSFLLQRREELSTQQLQQTLAEEPRRITSWLLVAAEGGDIEAQALLGQALLDGHGIQRDAALARVWFTIASNSGHAMASNMLGRCHEHGWGGAINLVSAATFYRLAAERGLDWGMYNLANLLATGRGVTADDTQAFAWYRRAAQLGHAKSMNLVGRYLEPGDPANARIWYQRSAEAGDFRGQFSLACCLAAEQRWDEARHWLQRALTGGNLKFLRHALQQLQRAAMAPLADITTAYAKRCTELQNQDANAAENAALTS